MIAGLSASYVTAIKDGVVPCLENAVESTAKMVNAEAVAESVQHYKSQMKKNLFPTETQEELSAINLNCQTKATALFSDKVVFDKNGIFHKDLAVKYCGVPLSPVVYNPTMWLYVGLGEFP